MLDSTVVHEHGEAGFALLESKLTPPFERPGTIRRPGLVNRLRVLQPAGVTVLSAPLGYGKTTLLADWARADSRPFAWVSLDGADNDPVVLLTYVAEALDRIGPIEPGAFAALGSPGSAVRNGLALLGRSLLSFPVPAVIVLDDAHVLTDTTSRRVLSTLIDHLPEGVQFALATRVSPPLALGHLRAQRRLVEIGAKDLRLREAEAATLLRAAGIALPREATAELTERTEGWPAGLYLAALSLRETPAAASEFRGADRFVSDYFRDALLRGLPADRVRFLTRVSVLDRMSGALCDAVLRTTGSAEVLEDLESSNLFVVPLDTERRWYRFHRLFRDMLRDELERREAKQIPVLNARAATWCEQHDDLEVAIEYAHAAGDTERVIHLVSKSVLPTFWTGRIATVERWLAWLDDPELLERNPAIAVYGTEMYAIHGRAEDAQRWADAALRAGDDDLMPDGSPASTWKADLRAQLCAGGLEQLLADATLAVETMANGSPRRAGALVGLGVAYLADADLDRADSSFEAAVEAGRASGAAPETSVALAMRSLMAIDRGDWGAAASLADRAREAVRDARLEDFATSVPIYAACSRTALRRNDLAHAAAELDRGERLVAQVTHVQPVWAVKLRLELAKARIAMSSYTRAAELLEGVAAIVEIRPDLGALNAEAEELDARLVAARRQGGGWEASLTAAELRLLPLLTTHLTLGEIANRLGVSRSTVKSQTRSIYRKLGVSARGDAVERATALGLLEPTI